jgi:hypothetical protein
MNKSNTQLWKEQTERGNKTAGHFDIYLYTHAIAEDTSTQLFEITQQWVWQWVIIILWMLLTKFQTITFIINTCDQLPVEFNKEQTSVPWTSVEFPKAMGSLSHTHSWYKYVCFIHMHLWDCRETSTNSVSFSQKKTNKCSHNLVGVTHKLSDHHLYDRLQSLAAITLHQLRMLGVDKTIINCSILGKQ